MTRRIGILSLLQESNTFISRVTELCHFEDDLLLEGERVRSTLSDAHHEVGGFFDGLAGEGLTAVPLFAARALPYGTISAAAFEQLMTYMFHQVEKAGPLDGYLVAPHGATVSEAFPDADGHWLTRLREIVGPEIPIIGTLDLHANLSPAMLSAADALIAYRSNPHVDQRDRGIEAARLLARTLNGEVRPVQRASYSPFIMNIERQATADSPCKELYALAEDLRRRAGVLSASVLQGFPYADVAEMGSAAIVVTDDDAALAEACVTELAGHIWTHRAAFRSTAPDVEAALDRAAGLDGRICLLDMGDNVGGGSPGDATTLAHALLRRRSPRSFICLFDPAAVRVAEDAGIGASPVLSMGGNTDRLHGEPLRLAVNVLGLYHGSFRETEPRHGGFSEFDQGRSAVVRTDTDLTVMLTSKRMVPWSLAQFACCGLDPTTFDLLVAKGVNSPLAAYGPICRHFVRVNTPGVTASDLGIFDYRHRRTPMYPFEPEMNWTPQDDDEYP